MRSADLVNELAGIIRRSQRRILESPEWVTRLSDDSQEATLVRALNDIEDAIASLVMLHILLRDRDRG